MEIFEEYKRKFPSNAERKCKGNYRNKFQHKKNMCRIPGHDHEWKDCPKNRFNKVKKEENNTVSDDDSSSVSSSDESMIMMEYDLDIDESTVLSTDLPELITRKIWVESDDDSSSSDPSLEELKGSEYEHNSSSL